SLATQLALIAVAFAEKYANGKISKYMQEYFQILYRYFPDCFWSNISDVRNSKELHATRSSQDCCRIDVAVGAHADRRCIDRDRQHTGSAMGGGKYLPDGEIRDGLYAERGVESGDGA
ncbi:MAG: hypothetical protein J0H36_01430, partial [Hyphomicrobium denitrificans]|nr:hypothetical protein [Hyphomicrobium denitrificans]